MRLTRNLLSKLCLLLLAAAPSAIAQIAENAQPIPARVIERVDDARRVTLAGNTHPFARSRYQTGSVEPGRQMERIVLVLKRSPEQEAALTAFNERQQDPKSPDYHHWLHADEFGSLYGPSDSDIAAITSWLQNHGFAIYEVSKGRTMIQFSGSAAQVEEAFQVEMHKYTVNGEEHIANDRDPSIPEALTPVVTGIASLHNFFPKPQHVLGKRVNFNTRTHLATAIDAQPAQPRTPSSITLATPAPTGKKIAPQETYTYAGSTYEEMTPFDFASVYNILPLWGASTPITGKGVTIALSGVSDVPAADFNTFRSAFGLPASTLKTIVNGTDPGADGGGGQEENSLDVEMAGATAPGASIVLVVSGNTSTTGGDQLSDEYIVDKEVAPIMSASYGECELGLGKAGNAAFNSIWQQGATEGISIFESSGDQGSAGCSSQDTAPPNADQYGLQVNGMASSPYVTGVGGTDFTWSFSSTGASTYWNAANNSATLASAKGIMPEVPWNSTCTSAPLLQANSSQFSSSEALCNGVLGGSDEGLIVITGGSGGPSHCTAPTSDTPSSCAGGYAKPSWQSGFGSTSFREVPDISLFASGGFPDGLIGSAILFCDSTNGACNYSSSTGGTINEIEAQEVGGTSASSPLWAGIAALIVQKTGAKQGLINPTLYSLYSKQKAAGTSCNSNTVKNGNSCTFYDTTSGTNSQVCFTGAPNCVTNNSADQLGVLSGYSTTTGYDDATGLGTPNVANMVNAWPASPSPTPAVTLSTTALTFASTTVGATTAAQTVTVKNSGTAALTLTSETITGTNASSFIKSATTCGTSLAAGASCTVSVEFKPATTGALTASLAIADNASGSPQSVKLTGTGTTTAAPAVTLSTASLTFASTNVGATTAAQTVTVKNSGTAALTLTSETITGTNASSFLKSATTCGTSLAAGASCTVSVEFKPAAAGALTASLAIADNASGSPQPVKLTGTGVSTAATLTLTPSTLTFPSTVVGATSAGQTVTLKNTGTTTVSFGTFSFTGTNASSFTRAASPCGSALAAGTSCTLTLYFKPTATGTLTGALNIADNATGSPQSVKLTGTGASNASTLTLTPSTLTFPSTVVGVTSAGQTVTLKNTGKTAVAFGTFTFTGTNASSFTRASSPCGSALAAGASCTLTLYFKPTTTGTLTGTLDIADNATGSPQAIKLTGTGASAASTLTLTPSTLTFPSTAVGATSAGQAVTLKNTGKTAVTFGTFSFTGTNASSFTRAASPCGSALPAGGSCVLTLYFKPTAAGTLTGVFNTADNAVGSPQTVKLTGTAK